MSTSTRREDLVETDRIPQKPGGPSGGLIPEEARFDKPMQFPDPVRPDVVVQGVCETFMNGAGI
jgi:hypothetical protein